MTPPLLRNRPQLPVWATLLGDLFALFCAWVITRTAGYVEGMRPVLLSFLGCYLVAQFATGLSSSLRAVSATELLGRVFSAWLKTVLAIAGLQLLWPEVMPHDTILVLSAYALPALVAVRLATLLLRRLVRRSGRNLRFVVVAGTGPLALETAQAIEDHPGWGFRVLGLLHADDGPRPLETGPGLPVLGHFRDLPGLVKEHVIDEVLIAAPRTRLETVEELVGMARTIGLRVHVVADFVQGSWRSVQALDLSGHLLLTLTPFPDDQVRLLIKRAMDVLGSLALLVLLAPVLVLIGLVVKLTSKGPVLFVQKRAGLNGRLFDFCKFRTMVHGAEQLRFGLIGQNEMNGPVFKIKNDPRITRVGRFLRRYSLDELPQLWNVLKGDMSLVGPRPLMPHEVAEYESWHRRRMSMRPGLTCLWQVSGRNRVDFQRWMELDLEYIDRWSLGMDLHILARTLPAVMSGRGAS